MDRCHEHLISWFNTIRIVCWVLPFGLHLGVVGGGLWFILKDFLNSGHRAGLTGVQVSDLHSALVALLLDLHLAGAAAAWTSGHFNLAHTPVDLRVMLMEPGVSWYHILVDKTGCGKVSLLRVVLVAENDIYHLTDGPCFIGGAINIVHWDGTSEGLGSEPVLPLSDLEMVSS